MTFQKRQRELVNAIIADLCNISTYPDGLFPHTVFVEEECENTGEPVYNHYKLVSINQSKATCVLEKPTTQEQDEFELRAIETDWLITVLSWCQNLIAEQDKCTSELPDSTKNEDTVKPADEKELWAYLFPMDEFDRDASDEEIIAGYESDANFVREMPIERLTPDELAAVLNDDAAGFSEQYVRFIETV